MLVYFHKFVNQLKKTPARKNKIIVIPLILAFIFNLSIWLLIYFKLRPLVYNLPEEQAFIPLHYNIALGIDNLGHWQKIFYIPAIGLLFLIINSILSLTLYNKKEIIAYFLSLTATLLQIVLFASTLLIILINI